MRKHLKFLTLIFILLLTVFIKINVNNNYKTDNVEKTQEIVDDDIILNKYDHVDLGDNGLTRLASNQYTITFNAMGGNVSPTSQTVTKGGTYGDLPVPTRDGYEFVGWFTIPNGTFDAKYYADNNADLFNVFGYNYNNLLKHWYEHRDKESRTCSAQNIQPHSIYKKNGNQTLYAVWQEKGKIHFIHAGDADAIVLQVGDHFGLVDAGYNYAEYYPRHHDIINTLSYLNTIGATHLDFIISTHCDPDHAGGLPAIVNSSLVNNSTKFYYREPITQNELMDTIKTKLAQKGATIINMENPANHVHKSFSLGTTNNKFDIELMNLQAYASNEGQGNENKNSIVAYVTYNGYKGTLLTGDMESQDEYRMADNHELANKPVEVLKIAHHGWQSSTTMKFVKIPEVHPQKAIISNSVVLDDISASIYYFQQKYGTEFYLTQNATEAVVVEYGKGLAVHNENGGSVPKVPNYTATEAGYGWRRLQNGIYFYFGDGGVDYIRADQFLMYNNNWYYVGIGGNMMTGWAEIKHNNEVNLYYFGNDGKMVTGWVQARSISPYNNTIPPNFYNYKNFMYTHENVSIPSGWYEYTNAWANGVNWFYFESSGKMAIGWRKIKYNNVNHWYYFTKDGIMLSNTTQTINGKEYTFNASGVCITYPECNA